METEETTTEEVVVQEQVIEEQAPIEADASQSKAEEAQEEVEDGREWYAVQCYSLQEYKVKDRIEQLMENELNGKVHRVLLPEEETVEIKNNKRQEKISKIYPGYIFVQMLPDPEAWFFIKQIPGTAKMISERNVPTPVSKDEIKKILRKVGEKSKKIEVDFEINEMIKVISGPFRGYTGVISEINADRGKVKALISIFGRETPVELEFDQVEKAVGN